MMNDTPRGGIGTPERPAAEPMAPSIPGPPPQPMYPAPGPGYSRPAEPYAPYGFGYPVPPRRPKTGRTGWIVGLFVALAVVVALVAALVAAVIGWAVTTRMASPTTATTTKTFAVAGAPALDIRDTAGNVTIQRGDPGQVTIRVTKIVRAVNAGVAHRELGNMAVTTTQNGNAIAVAASFSPNFFDGVPSTRSVDVVVTTPADTTVATLLNAGNVAVSDIHGALSLETNAGNIEASGVVFADASRLSTNAGNITVNGALQPGVSLTASCDAGNVTMALPADTPAHLDSRVNVGSISVSGWPITVTRGNMVGATASGDLGTPASGTVRVTVGAGNFTLSAR